MKSRHPRGARRPERLDRQGQNRRQVTSQRPAASTTPFNRAERRTRTTGMSRLAIVIGIVGLCGLATLLGGTWLVDQRSPGSGLSSESPGFATVPAAYSSLMNEADLSGEGVSIPTLRPEDRTRPQPSPVGDAPIDRLRIPALGIDARVVPKGIDATGTMEAPDQPMEVAWYNFTSVPGAGSNAVFSGHLDYRNLGPAVFWNLAHLESGDDVQVLLADGRELSYRVVDSAQYPASSAPVDDIVGSTPNETITLITCAGKYSKSAGTYDQRLVVRAERI